MLWKSASAPRVGAQEPLRLHAESLGRDDSTSLEHRRANELLSSFLTIHFSSSKCKSLVKRPRLHQLVCTKCLGV